MKALLALCLLSAAAAADSISTTYVCRQADGHMAIQDRPCDAGQPQVKTIDTVHHVTTVDDMLARYRMQAAAREPAECGTQRSIDRVYLNADRQTLNNHVGAGLSDSARAAEARMRQLGCSP